ncbi:hypothetical protein, partial [Hyphomonas atlantica]|uniref:hypothetical protein n=1 Tax=Hyphomonas atlantica TaxID=1280948 RepID=UPI003517D714
CPARRAGTLHSVAIYKSSGGAPRRPPRRRLRQTELDYRIPGWRAPVRMFVLAGTQITPA